MILLKTVRDVLITLKVVTSVTMVICARRDVAAVVKGLQSVIQSLDRVPVVVKRGGWAIFVTRVILIFALLIYLIDKVLSENNVQLSSAK